VVDDGFGATSICKARLMRGMTEVVYPARAASVLENMGDEASISGRLDIMPD
jgi:hypothetical protein